MTFLTDAARGFPGRPGRHRAPTQRTIRGEVIRELRTVADDAAIRDHVRRLPPAPGQPGWQFADFCTEGDPR